MERDESHRTAFSPWFGLSFLIGCGFFTMGLMDPLYDSYLPIFLGRWIPWKGIIGAIMTLDNILAVLLIPIVAVWSDRTRTGIGRRMPFILVTLPASAVLFALIPYAAESSLALLVSLIFTLNLFKQGARGPVVALMPDLVPGRFRSEANGVINTMGGIAAIVGTVALAKLMDLHLDLPIIGRTEGRLPFPVAGVLILIATLVLFLTIKEKNNPDPGKADRQWGFRASLAAVRTSPGAIRILVALLLWSLAYQGVLPFIGSYSLESLGTSPGNAAMGSGMVAIAYALFAVPSGYLAHRFGRGKTIRVALGALTVILLALFLFQPLTKGLCQTPRIGLFWGLMFLFGLSWVSVVTNSFPMLWQMASHETTGIYTGLYYTSSQAAAIAAPPVTGGIIDIAGYPGIFLFGALCMAGALTVMRGLCGAHIGEADAGMEAHG